MNVEVHSFLTRTSASVPKPDRNRAAVGLQLVILRTVYSQAQDCVCAALQLGGDVEQPWLMSKYDVLATPPEEDRATAIGNMHKNG